MIPPRIVMVLSDFCHCREYFVKVGNEHARSVSWISKVFGGNAAKA